MEPLQDQGSLDLPPVDSGTTVSADAVAEGDAQAPATAPPAVDPKRVEELERQLETLTGRLAETQAWGHSQNQAALTTQAMLDAMAERDRRHQEYLENQRRWQPPSLSEEQAEQLLQDPRLLDQYVKANADYAAQYTYAYVEPQLRHAHVMADLVRPVIEREVRRSFVEAEALAKERGIEPDEFRTLAREAEGYFGSMPDQTAALKLKMDPAVVLQAVQYLQTTHRGPAVRKPRPAPMLGGNGSEPAPSSVQTEVNNLRNSETVQKMQAELGMQFKPETLAEFQQRRRAAAAQGGR